MLLHRTLGAFASSACASGGSTGCLSFCALVRLRVVVIFAGVGVGAGHLIFGSHHNGKTTLNLYNGVTSAAYGVKATIVP